MRLSKLLFSLLVSVAFSATAQNVNYTPDEELIYRINFGSAQDVKLLLAKGANPNTRTKQGETALDVAIDRNDPEAVDMAVALINQGADPNAPDKLGNPPIIDAIHYKQSRVVKALLDKGVDFHIRSPQGTSLVDYAKKNGDFESAKIISDLIGKEEAYDESLRTPDHFKEIVHHYVTQGCVYQYWNFFLSSRQEPAKDGETNKKISDSKNDIYKTIARLQKYYPTASTDSLRKAQKMAVDQIFTELDGMISNRNRIEHAVGTDADAEQRCKRIVEGLNLEFITGSIPPEAKGKAGTQLGKDAILPMDSLSPAP